MGPDIGKDPTRLTGQPRTRLAATLAERYAAGETVRALAASIGRSYGLVYQLLQESGVTLRSRGGAFRRNGKKA